MQRTSHVHRKDGSSVRPKSSMLEKAIRELEKMVAECKLKNTCYVSIPNDYNMGKFLAN